MSNRLQVPFYTVADDEWFCGMVNRGKASSLISSRNHCQKSSPSQISDMPRERFEPVQNLSSGFVEWSYPVMITTIPRHHTLYMLSFHVRLERPKLIYYSLTSIFPKYHFKTGALCLVFLSSLVFTSSEFDNYYFGILKVKQGGHNEIKPQIGNIFRWNRPIRNHFTMSRK